MTYTFRVEVQDRNGDGEWEVREFERQGDDVQAVVDGLRQELAARSDLNDFNILSGDDENGNYVFMWRYTV